MPTDTQARELTIVQALREAVREEMDGDRDVFVLGEDVRIGGSFLFTLGLHADYGDDRVINTPISESGFVGLAIGAAIQGLRPIVDFQYSDFLFTAYDQIVQEGSKIRYMSGGQVRVPIVLQLPTGASGRGAQHANTVETFFFHVPGVKIVTPATPYDAKGLFKTAVRDDNMVLFCVHKHLYGSKGRRFVGTGMGHVPEEEYTIPFGRGRVSRAGRHATVVANSIMLHHALRAAETLAERNVEVEVIDPRTLVPFDTQIVIDSVKKTGRLVVAEEGNQRGGWGTQVAADVASQAIEFLDAPIVRVAAPDTPVPFSPVLEQTVVPGEDDIVEAVHTVLKGFTV